MSSSSDSSSEENINIQNRGVHTRINFDSIIGDHEKAFRFPRQIIDTILIYIGEELSYPTNRNCSLTSEQQLKLILRFLASNGFYRLIGNADGEHKSTVCRAIKKNNKIAC